MNKKQSTEMSPKELSNLIKSLELESPLTKKFEQELSDVGRWDYEREEGKKHANNQRDHWVGFLSEYNGPGYYNRKVLKGRTAQFAYNHCACPPMLLWLSEAAGVQKSNILLAKRRALKSKPAYASMCAAIREVIPWEIVEECLINKK